MLRLREAEAGAADSATRGGGGGGFDDDDDEVVEFDIRTAAAAGTRGGGGLVGEAMEEQALRVAAEARAVVAVAEAAELRAELARLRQQGAAAPATPQPVTAAAERGEAAQLAQQEALMREDFEELEAEHADLLMVLAAQEVGRGALLDMVEGLGGPEALATAHREMGAILRASGL